jgi:predicted DNA-binding transcriptional regulator
MLCLLKDMRETVLIRNTEIRIRHVLVTRHLSLLIRDIMQQLTVLSRCDRQEYKTEISDVSFSYFTCSGL